MGTEEEKKAETEFLEGLNSGQDNSEKKGEEVSQPAPEPSPESKPEKKETEDKSEESTGKKTETDNGATKASPPEKDKTEYDPELVTRSGKPVTEETYKQRWKTADGTLKKADMKIKELEVEIERIKSKPEIKTDEAKIETDAKETAGFDKLDELDELESKRLEALLAEDKDEAKKIGKQIETLRFQIFTEASQRKTAEVIKSEIISEKMTDAVEQIRMEAEKKYPFLDVSKPDTCNPYAVRLIQAVRDDYRSQGLNFVEALNRAVDEVASMFNGKVETKPLEEPKGEPVDKDKLKSTVVVSGKSAPVNVTGKKSEPGSYEAAWAEVTK